MKKILTLLLLGSAVSPVLFSQSIRFTRTYGGDHYDDARSIAATSDGGFVFTGLHKTDAADAGSMYLTKVNAAGAVLWTQYYLRPEEDGGNHVLPTADGGFLITGHTALSYGVNCDGFVVKTDAWGKEQWRSFVGGLWDDVCDAALELPDGSFLVAGRTEDPESHTFRMLLARLNPLGVVISQKSIPTRRPSVAYAMASASDGELFVAGYAYGNGEPDNMLLVKCSPDGVVRWSREWGSELPQRANAVAPTPDGGCFVAGGANNEAGQYQRMAVSRFNSLGEQIASSTVLNDSGAGYLFSAVPAPGGRLAVAGVLRPKAADHGIPCYILLDPELNIVSWQTVDLPRECRTRCITPNPAGGFLIGGNTYLDDGKADIFLAALSEQASILSGQELHETPYLLFPNPFRDFTYLKAGRSGQMKTLMLTTVEGRVLRRAAFETDEYLLQRGDLPAGVYFMSVVGENGALMVSTKLRVE